MSVPLDKESTLKYNRNMTDEKRKQRIQYMKDWRIKTGYNLKRRQEKKERRLIVLKYYSSETPFCACCGEKTFEFLAIDHIKGDGNKHRKSIRPKGGFIIVDWIIKNNFPPLFQILCHNCNNAKGFWGKCPHSS